ncbi:MAG TPA: NAD(+)/NADH kinase, partial [Acetivibrio sp.]|nr:NAD(+)/NADH kinase [Acetivibrio sp.]
ISRIIHLKTYINDSFMDLYPGDGLIISTPTGSTAYSLSAGGPLVEPDVDLIIATPICPHLLYSRSFITTGDRVVKVVVDESYEYEAMVTVDGQKGYEVKGGDLIVTKKSQQRFPMIRLNNKRNFFDVLRGKIYDRGESMG